MLRIGIVGCGRILNAHLQGYRKLRTAGWPRATAARTVATHMSQRPGSNSLESVDIAASSARGRS